MTQVQKSNKIRARPVWARRIQRTKLNTEVMPPPTEEEKADAIKVLADPDNAGVPGLWLEAHRILDEYGQ